MKNASFPLFALLATLVSACADETETTSDVPPTPAPAYPCNWSYERVTPGPRTWTLSNCDDGKGYVLACQDGTCTCTVDGGAPKTVDESAIAFNRDLPTFASLTAACSVP